MFPTLSVVHVAGLGVSALLLCTGCEPVKCELSGSVSINQTPAEDGQIFLIPLDLRGEHAEGKIQAGAYHLTVLPGSYRVELFAHRVLGDQPLSDEQGSLRVPIVEQIVPESYNTNSGLTIDCKAGKQRQNYDILRLQ